MNNYDKYFSLMIEDLKEKNESKIVFILRKSLYEIEEIEFNTYYYIAYFKIQIKMHLPLLNSLKNEDIADYKTKIFNSMSRFFNDKEKILKFCDFEPIIENFIDWDSISGYYTKQQVIELLEEEENLLRLSGTGTRINDIESKYTLNHKKIRQVFKKLKVDLPFDFESLWNWYNYYKNDEKLKSYSARISLLKNKYGPIFDYLDNSFIGSTLFGEQYISGWEEIDASIYELKNELLQMQDRIKINEIGTRCRETINLLAKQVYQKDLHESYIPLEDLPKEKKEISTSDSYRCLSGYLCYVFQSTKNDETRKYAKSLIALVNKLTHDKDPSSVDAKICIDATISLIQLFKTIYESTIKQIV